MTVGGVVRSEPGARLRRWADHGAVLALPGVLALVALTWWGIDRDAWLDEALSIAATHQLGETYDRTAYTMATYYAQLTVWTTPGTELWWVRLLSVAHAAGAVLVVGALAARAYGRRVALWSTFFLGCSWMMVRYGHEARSFAFVVLLVSLGWLATDRLVEDPHRRRWIACHLVVGILAPLTHGMAAFALGWQAVAVLASGAGRRTWYATVPGWAATVIGTGLLYQAGGSELGTPAESSDLEFIGAFLEPFHGGPVFADRSRGPWLVLFAFTLAGSVLCVNRLGRSARGPARFRAAMAPAWGLGTVLGILLLNSVRPGVHVRYAIGAVPGLALLWALTAEHLRTWFLARRARPLRLVGQGSLASLGVLAVLLAGQYRYHEQFPTGWTQLVHHIADDARPGDGVAVPNPNRVPFDVAWGRLEDPPDLASVAHVQPLGTVRRFDNYPGEADVHWQVVFSDRLWIVERDVGSAARRAEFRRFMDTFVLSHGFVEVDSWPYGEARLHLAVKRGGSPSG